MANGTDSALAVRGPELPAQAITAELVEQVIAHGDLSKLSAAQKVAYYRSVCESLGLNPLTRPLEYIALSGKLALYLNAGGAAQLRTRHGVSVRVLQRWTESGLHHVRAEATTRDGRRDEDEGIVLVENLKGEALANAYKKALTQAHRRVTLSLLGLSWLDTASETAEAMPLQVDYATGELTAQLPAGTGDPPYGGDTGGGQFRQPATADGPPAPPAPAAPVPSASARSAADLLQQYRELAGKCRAQGIPDQEIHELGGRLTADQLTPEITRLAALLAAV